MASPRKSAVQVKARELARERAAAYLRRQDTLLDLAATFYAKQAERDSVAEKEAARIEAVRAEFAAEAAGVEQSMAGAVAAMVATGEPVAAVAERLGLKPKEVRALADASSSASTPPEPVAEGAGEGDGDAQEPAGEDVPPVDGVGSGQEHVADRFDQRDRDVYAAPSDGSGTFAREPVPVG